MKTWNIRIRERDRNRDGDRHRHRHIIERNGDSHRDRDRDRIARKKPYTGAPYHLRTDRERARQPDKNMDGWSERSGRASKTKSDKSQCPR